MRVAAPFSMVSVAFATSEIHDTQGHSAVQHNFPTTTGVCGDTTWVNDTPTGSASLSSCKAFLDNAYPRDYGFNLTGWTKDDSSYLRIDGWGDCAFEVKVTEHADGGKVPITAADINDLMADGIKKYASGECFGVSGESK